MIAEAFKQFSTHAPQTLGETSERQHNEIGDGIHVEDPTEAEIEEASIWFAETGRDDFDGTDPEHIDLYRERMAEIANARTIRADILHTDDLDETVVVELTVKEANALVRSVCFTAGEGKDDDYMQSAAGKVHRAERS